MHDCNETSENCIMPSMNYRNSQYINGYLLVYFIRYCIGSSHPVSVNRV